MTTTTLTLPEAGAGAPAQDQLVDSLEGLFPERTLKRRIVALKDMGKSIELQELKPKDYEECNHAAVSYENGIPKLDNRLWNSRLVAMSILIKGKRPWKDEQGWRVLALRFADNWTIPDLQQAAEVVAELSGISKKAREALEQLLGKDLNETETAIS